MWLKMVEIVFESVNLAQSYSFFIFCREDFMFGHHWITVLPVMGFLRLTVIDILLRICAMLAIRLIMTRRAAASILIMDLQKGPMIRSTDTQCSEALHDSTTESPPTQNRTNYAPLS